MSSIQRKRYHMLAICLLFAMTIAVPVRAADSLGRAFNTLRTQNRLTIGWLGGSITAGTGASTGNNSFVSLVTAWLQNQYPSANISALNINAGIGGTGSDLGSYRAVHDVGAADLVFIEFAVNDGQTDAPTITSHMEGIIRALYRNNPNVDIVVLATGRDLMWSTYPAEYPSVATDHEIANHYTINGVNSVPFINLGLAIWQYCQTNNLSYSSVLGDGTHPNDLGHSIYAQTIENMLTSRLNDTALPQFTSLPQPLQTSPGPIEGGALLDASAAISLTGWTYGQGFQPAMYRKQVSSGTAGTQLDIPFTGTGAGVYYAQAPDDGPFDMWVDDGSHTTVPKSGVTYERCDRAICTESLATGPHTLHVKVNGGGTVRIQSLMVDRPNSSGVQVQLLAVANSYYTTTNLNTWDIVLAGWATIPTFWEQYCMVNVPSTDGKRNVAFKSLASGYYLTADLAPGAGNIVLAQWATAPTWWETYQLINRGAGYYALYSPAAQKYVTAGGSGILYATAADATQYQSWFLFN